VAPELAPAAGSVVLPATGAAGDPGGRFLGPAQVPASQDDLRTARGENPGCLEAQARVRTGDDDRTPPLSWYVRLGPAVALAVAHR
jgi:hypothetical protein